MSCALDIMNARPCIWSAGVQWRGPVTWGRCADREVSRIAVGIYTAVVFPQGSGCSGEGHCSAGPLKAVGATIPYEILDPGIRQARGTAGKRG